MMFIKAYASGGAGPRTVMGRVNNLTGVSRRENPMSRYYRQGGQSAMGGNRRTRGRATTITPVRGR